MTPFDHFLRAATAWLDTAWYLWVAMAATALVVVLAVVLTKARNRARRRIPQYRRQTSSR